MLRVLVLCEIISSCEIITTDDGSKEAILSKVAGVDAIFWLTHTRLDAEILDKAGLYFIPKYFRLHLGKCHYNLVKSRG